MQLDENLFIEKLNQLENTYTSAYAPIYETDNVYDLKNLFFNKPKFYRFLWIINVNIWGITDGNSGVHKSILDALEDNYYISSKDNNQSNYVSGYFIPTTIDPTDELSVDALYTFIEAHSNIGYQYNTGIFIMDDNTGIKNIGKAELSKALGEPLNIIDMSDASLLGTDPEPYLNLNENLKLNESAQQISDDRINPIYATTSLIDLKAILQNSTQDMRIVYVTNKNLWLIGNAYTYYHGHLLNAALNKDLISNLDYQAKDNGKFFYLLCNIDSDNMQNLYDYLNDEYPEIDNFKICNNCILASGISGINEYNNPEAEQKFLNLFK